MAVPTGARQLYADQALLLIKAETTPGTDAVPTASENAVKTRSCTVTPNIETIQLERYAHTFQSPGVLPAKSFMEFEVEIALVAPVENTNYMSAPKPRWEDLLTSSGFGVTLETDNTGTEDFFAAVRCRKPARWSGLEDGMTLTVSVDGAADSTVTFNTADFADITAPTAAEVKAVIDADLAVDGGSSVIWRNYIIIKTDTTDNTGSIEVTGGTAAAIFDFPEGEVEAYNIVQRRIYEPDSQQCASTCTLDFCMFPACAVTDDVYWRAKALGSVANVEMSLANAEEALFKFSGKGAWGGITTPTYTSLVNLPTDVPAGGGPVRFAGDDMNDAMIGIGATLEFDTGTDPTRTDLFSKLSINMNWDVNERPDQTQARGIRAFFITRKNGASGSYDPEEWVTDVYDRWSAVINSVRQSFTGVYTSQAGSRLTIEIPNLQFGNPKMGKGDGLVRHENEFYLRDLTADGDDYLKMTFEPQP